jgi:NAD(P)-dependent dehydrogenase (short-subunit alcohol dehydrogenase family)
VDAASRKVALVTGGTSGIGKAVAAGLAKQGYAVTLVARDAARGEAARRETLAQEVLLCDLASQASIREAAARWLATHEELHVLVNAAGVFVKRKTVTPEGLELTFATNYVAYFLLTNLLLDALKRGAPSRVVNVASKYGRTRVDLDDLQLARKPYSYFRSTPPTMLERVLFTQELAERLRGTGVVANALHPGLVAHTKLLDDTGGFFRWLTHRLGKSPEVGADTALWLATAPEAAQHTGGMFEKRKPIPTPGQGSDPAARRRLWDETARLVKLA